MCIGVMTKSAWRGGEWSIDPLCYVWILGQHCDYELVGVVFIDVGFEVSD